MSKTKKRKKAKRSDDVQAGLLVLIRQHEKLAGTDKSGAFRDVLTDLMHVCDELGLAFDARLEGAREVYEEEKQERMAQLLVVVPDDRNQSVNILQVEKTVGMKASSIDTTRDGIDVLFYVESEAEAEKLAKSARKLRFVKSATVAKPEE